MGAPRKLKTPEVLYKVVTGYFQWLEDNPFLDAKLIAYHGVVTIATSIK